MAAPPRAAVLHLSLGSMSIRAIASALDLMPEQVSPKARLVAVAIADTVGDDKGYGYPSIDTLRRRCGLSRSSVFRAITELHDAGVIDRHPRYLDGRQTSTAYVWRLWAILPEHTPGVSR